MTFRFLIPPIAVLVLSGFSFLSKPSVNPVIIIGQMKDVMWKGELSGKINLDTISDKNHLFGLGPVEYLRGEILIIDGKCYKSRVVSDSTMQVEVTYNIKAPFFGYTNVEHWNEHLLPDSVQSIPQLENYLDATTNSSPRPFMFRLRGEVTFANIHIVNLPVGSHVSSPQEAHVGQKNYELNNEQSEIIGFFSTEHKTIFTHHDTFLHMHLITADLQKMGHLDDMRFNKGAMKLYLPF